MRGIMKHSIEKGTSPEKRISINPILTYYHYYHDNDENKNEKEDLLKTKRYLRRYTPSLNSGNDIEFEYY